MVLAPSEGSESDLGSGEIWSYIFFFSFPHIKPYLKLLTAQVTRS